MNKMDKVGRHLVTAQRIASRPRFVDTVRKSFVIRSIPKSGTNFLRMMVSNYVCNLDRVRTGTPFQRISYTQMHTEVFPNVRASIFRGAREYVEPRLRDAPEFAELFADFMYDHGCVLDKISLCRPKKLVLLHRNPLDFIVSSFYYFYRNRPGREGLYDHPRQIIDAHLPRFIHEFGWMTSLARSGDPRVHLLSYEDLVSAPSVALAGVMKFLQLPVYPQLVEFAARESSIKATRKEERERGGAIHQPLAGIRGSFARSGEIGQWQEYFSEEDLEQVRRRLVAQGLSLDFFSLTTQHPR